MGFQLEDKTLLVRFKDPYEGLEVELRLNVPLGIYFDIAAAAESQRVEEAMGLFSTHCLIAWNLEDGKGKPVPATPEGFRLHATLDLARILIERWVDVSKGEEAPLGEGSQNGVPVGASPGF